VNDLAFVGVLDGLGRQSDQPGRLGRRQRLWPQPPLQAAPFHQFHGKERAAAVLAYLEDLHNARVLKLRHRLGLGAEPLDQLLVRSFDHLQADQALKRLKPGPVDDAHAPLAQQRQDVVAGHLRQGGGFGIRPRAFLHHVGRGVAVWRDGFGTAATGGAKEGSQLVLRPAFQRDFPPVAPGATQPLGHGRRSPEIEEE
jgi:hypothetical protein